MRENSKTEKFDIRLSQQEEALIREAALLLKTTPTNFIRQQSLIAATSVIHEQSQLTVSPTQWIAIEDALNSPAKVLTNLQKKFSQLEP